MCEHVCEAIHPVCFLNVSYSVDTLHFTHRLTQIFVKLLVLEAKAKCGIKN